MLRLLVKVFSILASIKGLALGRSFYFAILSLLWMICEFHLIWARIRWSCSKRSRYFWRKKKLPQKWAKNRALWTIEKTLFFSEFSLWSNFKSFTILLYKSHVWEIFGSWDIGWNRLGQSNSRIFKSTISLKWNEKLDWSFWC